MALLVQGKRKGKHPLNRVFREQLTGLRLALHARFLLIHCYTGTHSNSIVFVSTGHLFTTPLLTLAPTEGKKKLP